MAELQRLYVRVLGDIQDLEKKLGEAERRTLRFGQQMQSVGRGLTLGVTAPLVGLGTIAATAAVDLDRLRRGLEVSAGSAEAAGRQLRELERIARMPGLGFREAISGAVQLNTALEGMPNRLRYSTRMLEQFGNAVALTGGGAPELNAITVQLGQMAAAGRVLTADLRPIIQTAPAVATALRQAFGTIDAQEIEAMGLSSQEFFDRLLTGLESLPRAARGPAQAFEDFTDSLFRARAAIGGAMLPAVTELTNGLAEMLEQVEELDPAMLRIGVAFGAALALVGPLAIGLGALTTTITALTAAGVSLSLAIAGPAALVGGLGLLAGWWVKNKLDAAAFRGELERLRDTAREVSGELSMEQIAGIVRGRRETLAAYQSRRAELIAEQRARLGASGLGAGALADDASVIRSMTGEMKREFQNVERVIAATEGTIAGLFSRFQELKQGIDDTTESTKALGVTLPMTSEAFRYLMDLRGRLETEIGELRIEAALAAGTDEAERLNERLEAMVARLERVRGALSRFPADASRLAPRPDVGASIGMPGFVGLDQRAQALMPSRFEEAQRLAAMYREAGYTFDRVPEEVAAEITAAFREQREIDRSWARATAEATGGLGWGDVGAALTGIGGIAGGRAGGVFGGVGGAISAITSATNPLTAAIGAVGGAMTALKSVFDDGPSKIERMREALDRTLNWMVTRFDLLDTPAREQFEEIRRLLLDNLSGPLEQMLAQTSPDEVGAFIKTVTQYIDDWRRRMEEASGLLWMDERIAAMRSLSDEWEATFGAIGMDQLTDLLRQFKSTAEETDAAVRESLFNVPRGFKVALERFRATDPTALPGTTAGAAGVPGASTVNRGGDTFIFELRDVGQRDVRELVDEMMREIRRQKSRGGVTDFDLAFARV